MADMQQTQEVQWIMAGYLPEVLRGWFDRQVAPATPMEAREDWYLKLPHHVDLGIKLRQGRLEIKQRVAEEGVLTLADSAVGRVERWQKWSFGLDACQSPGADFLGQWGSEWIVIKKTRQLQTYCLTETRAVMPVLRGAAVAQGCEVDITQIHAFNRPWYSLCLEAFGPEAALPTILQQVAKTLLPPPGFRELTAEHSHSYPDWLSRMGSA